MPSIRLEMAAAPSGVNLAGLLVSIPPDTLHQRVTSFEHSVGASAIPCQASDSEQRALFVPASAGAHATFDVHFEDLGGVSPAQHFVPAVNRYVVAAPELIEAIEQLVDGASGDRE